MPKTRKHGRGNKPHHGAKPYVPAGGASAATGPAKAAPAAAPVAGGASSSRPLKPKRVAARSTSVEPAESLDALGTGTAFSHRRDKNYKRRRVDGDEVEDEGASGGEGTGGSDPVGIAEAKPRHVTKDKGKGRQRVLQPPPDGDALPALPSSSLDAVPMERYLQVVNALEKTRSEAKQETSKARDSDRKYRDRIKELEKALEEKTTEVRERNADLADQAKLITESAKHHDVIKEGLACAVCFEVYDDPHVLSCGHAACLHCLVKWFRSGNAYRGEDIEVVLEGENLTYRTKLCFTCREPVIRRPIRMYALRALLETLGLAMPRSADAEGAGPDADPWALTFPDDPTSYLVVDEIDGVLRCPSCGCETYAGRCQGCDAEFSDDGELDENLSDDSADYDILGADIPPIRRSRHGDEQPFSAIDLFPGANRQLRDSVPNMNLIDALADVDDDEGDSDEDGSDDEDMGESDGGWSDRPRLEYRSGSDGGYGSDEGNGSDGGLPPGPGEILRRGLAAYRAQGGELDSEDDEAGRRRRSRRGDVIDLRSPSPVAGRRRGRGRGGRASPMVVDEDTDYESSFIDDGEGEEEYDSEAEVDDRTMVEDETGSEVESGVEAPAGAAQSVSGDDLQHEELGIDELRRRRDAHFTHNARPVGLHGRRTDTRPHPHSGERDPSASSRASPLPAPAAGPSRRTRQTVAADPTPSPPPAPARRRGRRIVADPDSE